MKKKKLSNKTKGKIIIISTISLIITLIVGVILSRYMSIMWGGWNGYIDYKIESFSIFVDNGGLQTIFGPVLIVGAFVLFIMFVNHILPLLAFLVSKPLAYLKIGLICLKNRYSFRLHRIPLASLGGVREKSDIEIQAKDKILHIHFVDIPFPFLRMFLLVNDREYRMHRSEPAHLRGFGGFIRLGGREMDPKHFRVHTIPEFPQNEAESHYLVISPSYADSFFVKNNSLNSVVGESVVGNVTVCKMKVLTRRLNKKTIGAFLKGRTF